MPQHPPPSQPGQQAQQPQQVQQQQQQQQVQPPPPVEENYGDFASLLSGFGNGTSNGVGVGLGGDTDALVPPSASGSTGFNFDAYNDFDFDVR